MNAMDNNFTEMSKNICYKKNIQNYRLLCNASCIFSIVLKEILYLIGQGI